MERDDMALRRQSRARIAPRANWWRPLRRVILLVIIAYSAIWVSSGGTHVVAAGAANVIFALTNNNQLLRFQAGSPGTLLSSALPVTGLNAGDSLVAIDFRPATGRLYGLGVSAAISRLYTIDTTTGVATPVGGPTVMPQSAGAGAGSAFGFDFNPTVDRLRVVADSRDNFRLNPDIGAVAGADTALTAGAQVVGTAYDRNFSGATVTTLYGIDFNTDQLVTIGGINSIPSPNGGAVTVIGNLGVNTNSEVGFDIAGDAVGSAYASLQVGGTSQLCTVNLATGAATLVGTINSSAPIRDISVAPAGVLRFTAPTYTVSETGASASITVTRTGGSFGAVSVMVSTSNGSAVSAQDYAAVSTTLSFADGVASQTFNIPIFNDSLLEGNETVILNFSNYSGCGLTGGPGVLTIIDDEDGVCSIWGIDINNALLHFNADSPGDIISSMPVTGLAPGERLVGIDFRPATGELYAFAVSGAMGHLYSLSTGTAVATLVGPGFALPQSAGVGLGSDYGFDFNPTVDRIRVVTDSRDNFRLNPDTGTVAGADTALTAGAVVTGAAYDRNFIGTPAQASTDTTLYAIDANTDHLVTIGGINSTPSPNSGSVNDIGSLGFNTSSAVGFDIINGAEGTAYSMLTVGGVSGLYTISLATGAATPIGLIGASAPLTDIAVAPAGTVEFTAVNYIALESAGLATITVTRTGANNCCGSIAVTAYTTDGTATAPADYAQTTAALNFPEGVTSRTFTIPIVDDGIDEVNETVTLTLRGNIGGRITAPSTATLTITDDITFSAADPLDCVGPTNIISGAFTIKNSAATPVSVSAVVTLPAGLSAVPGTCVASVGTCVLGNPSTLIFNESLAPGQTASVTYKAQVGEEVAGGAQLCSVLTVSFAGGPALVVPVCLTVNCQVVGPGSNLPTTSEVNDQKAGSILVYNLYTSSTSSPNSQNTRISMTNTDVARTAYIHLYFVDGSSCSVADNFVCLTPNQTLSFLASVMDPGTTGYLVAVAVDRDGCPTSFNRLIGDSYVKFSSGHAANLAALSISAVAGGQPACNANSVTARLNFDGVSYNRLPRVLALDNIPSRGDGNDTMLIVNRLGGNLTVGDATITSIFGILYNDSEAGVSFSFRQGCQLRSSLANGFPRTTPRLEQFIPSGQSGWIRLYSPNDDAISGAALNYNGASGVQSNAFTQGHNLHTLRLTSNASWIVPVFPPSC